MAKNQIVIELPDELPYGCEPVLLNVTLRLIMELRVETLEERIKVLSRKPALALHCNHDHKELAQLAILIEAMRPKEGGPAA